MVEQTSSDSAGATSMLLHEGAVYCPEELSLLGQVLDQVVQSLPPNLRTPHNRVAIAMNILACAATGERDPDELRRAGLRIGKSSRRDRTLIKDGLRNEPV